MKVVYHNLESVSSVESKRSVTSKRAGEIGYHLLNGGQMLAHQIVMAESIDKRRLSF